MQKESLLYVCHRLPFPPNKGDKIRSFNILKHLSQDYEIHLTSFIDDPEDWKYVNELDKYCKSYKIYPLNPLFRKVKSLTALFTGLPLSLPYFKHDGMQDWVNTVVNDNSISRIFVFSSAMSQYVVEYDHCHRVADFVDVDSDKWRQYSESAGNPLVRWVYKREFRTLSDYENKITSKFDAITFVSDQEARFFCEQLPIADVPKVSSFSNGVDFEYFNPETQIVLNSHESLPSLPFIVFTGAMDYWANVDAVVWFVEHVWKRVKESHPELSLVIVGGNPDVKVKKLAQHDIIVTGRVADVRPYINFSQLAIAPLRIARGIQNKVLEAMAMDKVVIMTSMAAEGINLSQDQQVLIADEAKDFAKLVIENISSPQVLDNRKWISKQYKWSEVLKPLSKELQG